jgi:hypothetical protein
MKEWQNLNWNKETKERNAGQLIQEGNGLLKAGHPGPQKLIIKFLGILQDNFWKQLLTIKLYEFRIQ